MNEGKVKMHISVSKDFKKKIDNESRKRAMTISQYVVNAIEYYEHANSPKLIDMRCWLLSELNDCYVMAAGGSDLQKRIDGITREIINNGYF